MRPLCLLLLLVSTSAFAEDLFFSGRVFGDIYAPSEKTDDGEMNLAAATAWVQAEKPFLSSFKGLANVELRGLAKSKPVPLGETPQKDPKFLARVREGWAEFQDGGWHARVGQQMIPWGKSDGINPTDFLSSKDLTVFNPDEETKRLGHASLLLGWIPDDGNSNWNFTLVYTPLFTPSKILLSPKLATNGLISFLGPESQRQAFRDGEAGLKVSYAGDGWDADLIGYTGWDHLPFLQETSRTIVPPATVTIAAGPMYSRQTAVGLGASSAGDIWIFRLESAYAFRTENRSLYQIDNPDRIETVAGVERPIGERFRIQTQFVTKFFPTYNEPYEPDPFTVQLRKMNVLLHGDHLQNRMGGTLRFAYDPADGTPFSAEIFLLGYFNQESDYMIQPKATYKWTESLQTALGVMYFGGPEDQPLGLMRPFNSVFFEAKYVF